MPLPNHFTATLRMRRGNATASCILYYAAPGVDPEPEQLTSMADAVWAHVSDELRECLEPTTFFDGVDLRYRSNDLLLEASSTEDASAGLAAPADVLPEEDAVVIQRRTGLPGRGRSGRIFMPFVPENFAVDSKLTTLAMNAYKALGVKIKTIVAAVEGGLPALEPRQPIFKVNQLVPIITCRVLDNTMSRRDRRDPKRPRAVGISNVAG